MQGYSGRGNCGIARMNGGHGSRPLLMVSPSKEMAARYRRGVQVALVARDRQLSLHGGYYSETGLPLLWLVPWLTEARLGLDALDPLFVEVCRRVRLVRAADGGITAWGRPSTVARVSVPEAARGDVGDAWTPIVGGAALTISASGFSYRRMSELLAGEGMVQPPAMELPDGYEGRAWLHAAVLVRGKCKTEGLHERWLEIPRSATGAFRPGAPRAELGRLGKAMVDDAGQARRALRRGLQLFQQGAPDGKLDPKDDRSSEWVNRLDQATDDMFFPHLFRRFEDDEAPTGSAAWLAALAGAARQLFEDGTARLSPPENRRERALAIAGMVFAGMLTKAGLLPPRQPEEEINQ